MLVAAPSYLAARGVPRRLADLAHHSCIVLRQEHAAYDIWRLGDDQGVRVAGTLATNDGEIAVSWVLDGHGIMLRSEWDIAPHVRSGRLQILRSEERREGKECVSRCRSWLSPYHKKKKKYLKQKKKYNQQN